MERQGLLALHQVRVKITAIRRLGWATHSLYFLGPGLKLGRLAQGNMVRHLAKGLELTGGFP